jgi:hypothetical protein
MRLLTLPLSALFLVGSAASAFAHGGLPHLAAVPAGPHLITVQVDSRTLVTGRNTLTLEVPTLPADQTVTVTLHGPRGEVVAVPFRPLVVLDGAADTHAVPDAGPPAGAPTGMGHGSGDSAHGAHAAGAESPPAPAASPALSLTGAQAGAVPEGLLARGSVWIPSAGRWHVEVLVQHGEHLLYATETIVDAEEGGPSPLYLAVTGATIGGFLLFGIVQRQRGASQLKRAR